MLSAPVATDPRNSSALRRPLQENLESANLDDDEDEEEEEDVAGATTRT